MLAPALLLGALSAQWDRAVTFREGGAKGPGERSAASPADMPPLPRATLVGPHHKGLPALAPGRSDLPAPSDPPVRFAVEGGPGAPGDFRSWANERPAVPASTCCPEPAATINRDTALFTANTWGLLSRDSGQTWIVLNPASMFPSIDGGLCCDQRVAYAAGLTVWYLQYRSSTTTRRGSVRIAVAAGRDDLRASRWVSWVFDPQDFGEPLDRWLDFPDLSVSSQYLYCTSNVFDFSSPAVNKNAVVWRIALSDLWAGNISGFQYAKREGSNGLGASGAYRFVQSPGSAMYWASHEDYSTLRVYQMFDSSNTAAYADKDVPSWTDSGPMARAPNGVNWAGYMDGRVQSGYYDAPGGEYGFLWGCAQDSGARRPYPYVRVARFRTSDHSLIASHDLWDRGIGLLYPACATNTYGDKGVVVCGGGPGQDVRSYAFLVDQYAPSFGSQTLYAMSSPTRSPPSARWGDYLSVEKNPSHPATFVGTGAEMDPDGNAYARYLWFSRERDMPQWVDLDVLSTPVTGVPIALDVSDRSGARDGNTDFTRTFAPHQGYRLTAPPVFVSGGRYYAFDNWSGTGGNTTSTTIEVSSIGTLGDTMTATYSRGQLLRVRSTNPSSGMSIGVNVRDLQGLRSGQTPFNRFYVPTQTIDLSAPATQGNSQFQLWFVDDRSPPRRVFNQQVSITLQNAAVDITATAIYREHVPGSFTSFGTGCQGSNGGRLLLSASGTPEVGATGVYSLRNALPSTAAWLAIGLSNTSFGGIPLPFDNGLIGAPGCWTYCSHDLLIGTATDRSGNASRGVLFPTDTALIGAHVYTQYFVLDTRANRLGLTTSNAVDTLLGGLR